MPTTKRTNDERARLGGDIFDRQVRPALRPEDEGKFVAIDVDTGDYETDEDDYSAIALRKRQQTRQIPADLARDSEREMAVGPRHRLWVGLRGPTGLWREPAGGLDRRLLVGWRVSDDFCNRSDTGHGRRADGQ